MEQEELRLEAELLRLELTSRDCAALMPGGGRDTDARIASLEATLAALDGERADAEAQHRLYSLLAERTRWVFAVIFLSHSIHIGRGVGCPVRGWLHAATCMHLHCMLES